MIVRFPFPKNAKRAIEVREFSPGCWKARLSINGVSQPPTDEGSLDAVIAECREAAGEGGEGIPVIGLDDLPGGHAA